MSSEPSSFSNIYRVLRVLGSASLVTSGLSLLRNKAFAVFLGPAGYGSIVLLTALINTAGNLCGVGAGYSSTRLISGARGRGRMRAAAFFESCLVSLRNKLAVMAFVLTTLVLSVWWYFSGAGQFDPVWIPAVALGAALAITASMNTTRLQIMRLSSRLAAVSVGAALIHTVIGVCVAYAFGPPAIPVIVAAIPFSTVVASSIVLRRYPIQAIHASASRWRRIVERSIVRVGTGLMMPGVVDSSGGFAVRAAGVAAMGLAAVGQVYAAMALVTFVNVTVMTAMNQDFLPRLCESVGRRDVFRRQASEQLFVSLLLTAPVVLLVCTFSSEITHLLFSSQFTEAARVVPVMSILVVANIANWPIHTMQTALGRPRDQLSGSVANVLGALAVIAIFNKELTHGTFAAAIVCGGIAQLATQSTLLWLHERIAYSARDWIPGVLLVVIVLWLPFAEAYSPVWGRTAGLVIAVAWAAVGLMHYARHRS